MVWSWREALVYRLVCSLFTTTWFVPDEVYQSVEVAYKMVYGRGYLTWEWDSQWALRSTLHPLLYSIPFYILRSVGADSGCTIRWTPQILHAIILPFADVCYFRWLEKLFLQHNTLKLTFALYLSNWFILYCSTRTLSNTLECGLSLMALDCFTSAMNEKKIDKQCQWFSKCLFFVALATVIRPTTVLLWMPLCLLHLFEQWDDNYVQNTLEMAKYIISRCSKYALLVLLITLIADSCYYGHITFCLWNFLKFNVFDGSSANFGTHPWYWYFVEGLPPILGLNLLPLLYYFLFNFKKELNVPKRYVFSAIVYIIGHSFIEHKEHRFVLPVIPLLLPYFSSIVNLFSSKVQKIFIYSTILLNFIIISYIGLIHQRGPYATNSRILTYLNSNEGNIRILQLMPCFSLPHYASLHPYGDRVHIRMLDCGIDVKHIGKPIEGLDEADEFHANPEDWLKRYWFTERLFQYDLIITYKSVHQKIESFLMQKGYQRYAEIFHTILTSSDRQDSTIVILNKI